MQSNARTVEGELQRSLKKLFGKFIKFNSAGRTDSGVHAEGQVINFYVDTDLGTDKIRLALNHYLPSDIRCLYVYEADEDFHARFSAKSRTYFFHFTDYQIPLYLQPRIVKTSWKPDCANFDSISRTLLGSHDFKNFRNLGSNESSTIRTVYECNLETLTLPLLYIERFQFYRFAITANGFLYRMVRNIVGAFFEVLRGKQSLDSFSSLLNLGFEPYLYTTAPAHGLSLIKVDY